MLAFSYCMPGTCPLAARTCTYVARTERRYAGTFTDSSRRHIVRRRVKKSRNRQKYLAVSFFICTFATG